MFTDAQGFGGAESVLLTLLEGLDRKRWRPTLAYHPENDVALLVEKSRALDVELWEVPSMSDGLRGASRMLGFAAQLRSRKPAVFHAHLTWALACKFGLAAAVLARVPAVVATEQTSMDFRLTRPTYLQQRALGAGVGRFIAVSREVERHLEEKFGWHAPKVVVIPNAIDPARFRLASDPQLRAALSRDGSRPIVLATARLAAQKGLGYLLDAVSELPAIQLVIAGDGPDLGDLEAQAQRLALGDRVDFLGHRDDVAELLACADVVALPSLYEGLPLSVLEAMAAGKPVVATAIGGTDEAIVDGETGVLVEPRDAAALAEALDGLISDPARAARLGAAGRRHVEENFASAQMVERVMHVYDELLAGG